MTQTNPFEYLREHDPLRARREYRFRGIRGVPVLICEPASPWREDFLTAMRAHELTRGAKKGARDAAASPDGIDLVAFTRDLRAQVPLLLDHVVRDWRVADASGAPVPFSREACAQFFDALPDTMLREFSAWAFDLENFTDRFDEEAVAKN